MIEKRKKAASQIKPPDIPDDLSLDALPEGVVRDRETYDYVALTKVDLSGQHVEYVTFETARFDRVSMAGGKFTGLRLLDVRLDGCDLANADLYKASLERVEVMISRIVGLQAAEAEFRDVLFKRCKGEFTLFTGALFKSVRFEDCDLSEADFSEADLSNVVFSRCNLGRSDMTGAKLAGADFRGSNLEGVKVGLEELRGAIVDPTQAIGFVLLLGLVVKEEGEG